LEDPQHIAMEKRQLPAECSLAGCITTTLYAPISAGTVTAGQATLTAFINKVNSETVSVLSVAVPSVSALSSTPAAVPTISSKESGAVGNETKSQTTASSATITTLVPITPPNGTATASPAGTIVSATLFTGNSSLVWTDPHNSTLTYKIPAYLQISKKGIQPAGTAAGLAIGCLLAGAIIAALACFLLFSRQNKRKATQASHYEPTAYTDEHSLKHPTTITAVPLGAVGAASIVENNLPQPKEDNAIIGDLSRIKSRIEGHVDSYYHTAKANNQVVAQALSAALGTAFPVPSAKLQELLSNPRKCPALLRAAIAWIIVSRIDVKSGLTETFLPAHLAGATRDLTASRMDETSEFIAFFLEDARLIQAARVAFLSKWRQITAALSGNTFLQEMPVDDPRLTNIRSALELADTFLRPCAKDAEHDKRLLNLEEIMKRAARFGFLLFSQPSSFHFDWIDSGSGLVVFPGLLQVSDDFGKPVASPRAFGQKEVVPI
jgi:hypothetical protein